MSFLEVCQKLGIEQHAQSIFDSGHRGELFHIWQYFDIYEAYGDCSEWFGKWFQGMIDENEEKTKFIYQHVLKILQHQLKQIHA